MLYLYSKYFSFSCLPIFPSYGYSLCIVLNGALLFAKSDVNTKLDIIGNEFDIPLESDIRKDMNDMFDNLYQMNIKSNGLFYSFTIASSAVFTISSGSSDSFTK